jgi:hypothetical protein
MYESTVCACLFIICPLLNKKTYSVTPNADGITKNNNNSPDNLSGPVLPYRMISFK